MWCAALSHAMSRFEGTRPLYKQARSGGMGAFTVDNFPVFDYVRPNAYGIFDSNHGYKMLGVGRRWRRRSRATARRCSSHSGWSASPRGTFTPCRTRPTPGRDVVARLGACPGRASVR